MKKSSLKNYIAFLEADIIANASDYWLNQYELKDKELLKAKDEIAELRRGWTTMAGSAPLGRSSSGRRARKRTIGSERITSGSRGFSNSTDATTLSKGITMTRKRNPKKYSLGRFIFDLFMIVITGGLWLIYMIIKAIRES